MNPFQEQLQWPIPRAEIRSEKDAIAIIYDSHNDSTRNSFSHLYLPEVCPRPPTPQLPEVRPTLDSVAANFPEHINDDFPEVAGTEGVVKKRKICGIRLWIVVLLVVLVNLAVVGGVLGSTLASKSKAKPNSTSGESTKTSGVSQSTPVAELTMPTMTSDIPGATATASPTGEADFRSNLKIPSIIASQCGEPAQVQIFYLHSGALKACISGGNESWHSLGELSPSIAPKPSSPLAAVTWLDDGDTEIRLYYLDVQNSIIEFGCKCEGTSHNECKWFSSIVIVPSNVASNSSLAAVHYGNSTSNSEVRIFYENSHAYGYGPDEPERTGMDVAIYSKNNWGVMSTGLFVMPGTPIAVAAEQMYERHVGRVWYRKPDLQPYTVTFYDGEWGNETFKSIDGFHTSLSLKATIAMANPYTNRTDPNWEFYGGIIGDDKQLNVNELPQRIYGDDAGGALAALAWIDRQDVTQGRFFLSVNESVQEVVALSSIGWTLGAKLPS